MGEGPLIIPFQIEAYMTNNQNTPDKSCVRISPDYTKVEYTSYLGGKMEPPPFTTHPPLRAGVHLHFILPGCFRRAQQKEKENGAGYVWDYAKAPDRWIVTRMVLSDSGELSCKNFIVESNYLGLDNKESVAIPWLSDQETSHRFLGRCREYREGASKDHSGKEMKAGEYLKPLTAMGAGDPYFAAYYPNCRSVFGFYDDMAGVERKSKTTYFVCGFFSDPQDDPFYKADPETFGDLARELGFTVEDKQFYTDHCVLFGEVCALEWQGVSAEYPDGIPGGEIKCGIGNTSAEVISAVISQAAKEEKGADLERLFNALQYEVAEEFEEIDGIARVEDAIHARTFARREGGEILRLEFHDKKPEELPKGAGKSLAVCNRTIRQYNRKLDELAHWQDAAYAAWYSYMLRYEGDDAPSSEKETMRKEIFRLLREVIPEMRKEAEQLKKEAEACYQALCGLLSESGITAEKTPEEDFLAPVDPVVLLYGEGVKRNYAFVDEGNILCQTAPVTELSGETGTLQKADILRYTGSAAEIIPGFSDLLVQAVCLDNHMVEMIGRKEGILSLSCDKSSVSELVGREFAQSFLTFLMEWKVSFYPSRTLTEKEDDTMRFWKFDGLDYDNEEPPLENVLIYTGRNMITPHSLYQFQYVAKKYLSQKGEPEEEIIKVLERVGKLPVLSQTLEGLNRQFLSRRQALQAPIIGNESDRELTKALSAVLPPFFEKTAVNDIQPFFPLRAGHIRLEKINVVSTFGRIQNVLVKEMEPVCSEVMGEYTDQLSHRKFGRLRPRISGSARFCFEAVSAKDDSLRAEPVPEMTPLCGMILPELLNGRLVLYSPEGSCYGSIKTVYRRGKRQAAWVSPPGQAEKGFEDIAFEDKHFKEMVRCLLQDGERGGSAFTDLFALIGQQFERTLPAGMELGEELSCIWGRPLAVFQCRVSLERKGGCAYSQLREDYGKYRDLSVGKTEFLLMAGDMDRSSSGIVGYFEGYDYEKLYPAWNANGFVSDYIRFGEGATLCINGGEKVLTMIAEAGGTLWFQTGILPVSGYKLDGVHLEGIGKIKLCFEADSVVCIPEMPEIPLPAAASGERWYFEYTDRQEGGGEKKAKVRSGTSVFHEKRPIVCDGYLVLEQEEKAQRKEERRE